MEDDEGLGGRRSSEGEGDNTTLDSTSRDDEEYSASAIPSSVSLGRTEVFNVHPPPQVPVMESVEPLGEGIFKQLKAPSAIDSRVTPNARRPTKANTTGPRWRLVLPKKFIGLSSITNVNETNAIAIIAIETTRTSRIKSISKSRTRSRTSRSNARGAILEVSLEVSKV